MGYNDFKDDGLIKTCQAERAREEPVAITFGFTKNPLNPHFSDNVQWVNMLALAPHQFGERSKPEMSIPSKDAACYCNIFFHTIVGD